MRPFVETHHTGEISIAPHIPHAFPAHLHLHLEMVYLFSGSASMLVDGRPLSLSAGSLCLCFPGVIHGYLHSQTQESLMLILSPSLFSDFSLLLSRFHPDNPCLSREELPEDLPFCMRQILLESQSAADPRVLQGYLQVVLARVMPLFTLSESSQDTQDLVYRILQYLSEHFLEPMSLHDLSRAMGVGESHLSHLFSQRLKTSFRSYINALRIHHACLLLRSTDYSVTRIAYESGFETQRTFNRAFLDQCGASPREYRRLYLKSET